MKQVDLEAAGRAFCRLVEIMQRLRGPQGCPWDREQTMQSLRRYTLEEAYEVVQAIDDRDYQALPGELGDLLLQVVFLAQIGADEDHFDVADVANSISDKLVRRHPHIFGDVEVEDADEVVRNWEAIKDQERGAAASVIDDVPRSLPALERGQKLGKQAARIGFDWRAPRDVLAKVEEELGELNAALHAGEDAARIEEEIGDLLFAISSLARHLKVSAEVAANAANSKFERRFRLVETAVSEGRVGGTVEEMEAEWQRIKGRE
jgi:MazG family protein